MSIEQIVQSVTSGTRIFDEEHQEEIVITDEMITRSHDAKLKIQQSLFAIAEGLAEIRDYRLYLVDNCASFNAWLAQYASISRRNAFNYLRIIDKYANRQGVVQLVAPVERLGLRKLLAATKLPKDDFERFKRTGELITVEGQVIPLDELEQLSTCTVEAFIQERRGNDVNPSTRTLSNARKEHQHAITSILQTIRKQLPHVPDDELAQYEQELHALEQRIAQRIDGEVEK
jgi:hypothetical protein